MMCIAIPTVKQTLTILKHATKNCHFASTLGELTTKPLNPENNDSKPRENF